MDKKVNSLGESISQFPPRSIGIRRKLTLTISSILFSMPIELIQVRDRGRNIIKELDYLQK